MTHQEDKRVGTWGSRILQDDTARDAYDDYIRGYDEGANHDSLVNDLLTRYQAGPDHEADIAVWLGLAQAAWECGNSNSELIEHIRRLRKADADRWQEPRLRKKREEALDAFLGRLQTDNPKPRKRRGAPKFKPPAYVPGTCLAIRLASGQWGAALVLRHGWEGKDEAGTNLVGVLSYRDATRPDLDVFRRREWLLRPKRLLNGQLVQVPEIFTCLKTGHRKCKPFLEVVGHLPVEPTDSGETGSYGGWERVLWE